MKQAGLGEAFAREILPKIQAAKDAAVLQTLKSAADDLISIATPIWKNTMGHLGVTGNAYNSMTVGIYHKRKLEYVNWIGKHAAPPTMRSLGKGQPYPFEEYYEGDTVYEDEEGELHPYVGEVGKGGVSGRQSGPWVMYSHRYDKTRNNIEWSVVVAIPMEYAGFNPKIVEVMQALYDNLPHLVSSNIASVGAGNSTAALMSDIPF